jgi:hypothetical protein
MSADVFRGGAAGQNTLNPVGRSTIFNVFFPVTITVEADRLAWRV